MEVDGKTIYSRRIADLDSSDKPREKALQHGIHSLTNAELIALILGSGVPGKSVIELAQEILQFNGNKVGNLGRLTVADLVKNHKGVGKVKAITLIAAIELSERIKADGESDDPIVRDSRSIYNLMSPGLSRLNHEEFWIVLLSRSNKVIKKKNISIGGTSATVVDVKIIFKEAVDQLASSLILVHNHPSGNLNPSPEDDRLTMKIKDATRLFDICLLDHLIIAGQNYFSYADEGRL